MNAYRVLLRKPEEHDTKIDLRETGWSSMDWIRLAQYRDWWMALVSTVINLRVP
jgi:hypothetical protein